MGWLVLPSRMSRASEQPLGLMDMLAISVLSPSVASINSPIVVSVVMTIGELAFFLLIGLPCLAKQPFVHMIHHGTQPEVLNPVPVLVCYAVIDMSHDCIHGNLIL